MCVYTYECTYGCCAFCKALSCRSWVLFANSRETRIQGEREGGVFKGDSWRSGVVVGCFKGVECSLGVLQVFVCVLQVFVGGLEVFHDIEVDTDIGRECKRSGIEEERKNEVGKKR